MRYILLLLLFGYSSLALAYDVEAPDFWDGWERDDTVELCIYDIVSQKNISAHEIERVATEKNPEYAFYAGLLYYFGYQKHTGVVFERDYKKAVQYFEKARGPLFLDPYIDYYLGMIYLNGGDGIDADFDKAKDSLQSSDTPESFLMLAAMNYENPKEQLKWYIKLAYTGEWRAMLTVADWYEKGRPGITQSHEDAHYWYSMACIQKVAYACESLKRLAI